MMQFRSKHGYGILEGWDINVIVCFKYVKANSFLGFFLYSG